MVTEHGIERAWGRLAEVGYPKGDSWTIRGWRRVLEDITDDELADAVLEYAQEGHRYRPTPGQLRLIALGGRQPGNRPVSESQDWNQLQEGPCPVCGAVMQLVTWPNGAKRYGVVHDRAAHARANVPVIGDAK